MPSTDHSAITAWLHGRIPESWSTVAAPSITIDRDEITIVVSLEVPVLTAAATDADRSEAVDGRIAGYREDTREQRMRISARNRAPLRPQGCLGCLRR